MNLLWFFLGIIMIILISRYNESSKLFWILFVSFIGAFTVTSVVIKHDNKTKSKKEMVQLSPIQAQSGESNTIGFVTDNILPVTEVTSVTVPVGKDYTVAPTNLFFTFSKDGVKIFDKPPQINNKC